MLFLLMSFCIRGNIAQALSRVDKNHRQHSDQSCPQFRQTIDSVPIEEVASFQGLSNLDHRQYRNYRGVLISELVLLNISVHTFGMAIEDDVLVFSFWKLLKSLAIWDQRQCPK